MGITLLDESKNTAFSQFSSQMVRSKRLFLERQLCDRRSTAGLKPALALFGWIVISVRLVEVCLSHTEVAGHSGENYHPGWRVRIFWSGSLFGCFVVSGDGRTEPTLSGTQIRPFQPVRSSPDRSEILLAQ